MATMPESCRRSTSPLSQRSMVMMARASSVRTCYCADAHPCSCCARPARSCSGCSRAAELHD
eukprot:5376636-Lingulodinium_polyedra.AAC.1